MDRNTRCQSGKLYLSQTGVRGHDGWVRSGGKGQLDTELEASSLERRFDQVALVACKLLCVPFVNGKRELRVPALVGCNLVPQLCRLRLTSRASRRPRRDAECLQASEATGIFVHVFIGSCTRFVALPRSE